MKVGVLTLPFNNNYGGLLQSYALQAFLRQRGHDVYSIQQPVHNKIFYLKNRIKGILKIGSYVDDSKMLAFQRNNFKETLPFKSDGSFVEIDKYAFDSLVVGSDQVWRFNYTRDKFKRYFFDFVKDKSIKKISYAASFGVDFWEASDDQTSELKKLISQFSAVSVREVSGVQLCRKYLSYDHAIHVLDPTFLLSPLNYRNLFSGNEISRKGSIGVYFLDTNPQKQKIVTDIENQLSLKSFLIGKKNLHNKWGSQTFYTSVEQWIKDFESADYIVTDSFHGMVFSIIFKKPFCVIGNTSRGLARFNSLLDLFNLSNRLIDSESPFINLTNVVEDIDYSFLDFYLEQNYQISDKFFKAVGL